MRHNYFEGIFQLRSPTKEVLDFMEHDLQKKGDVFITKKKKLKDGFDMYMTSQRYMQILGRKLQKKFGGELKVSSQLFTRNRQTSKDDYRVNVLYRYHPFAVGEVRNYRGDEVRIMKMSKKQVTIKDVKTGQTSFATYDEIAD